MVSGKTHGRMEVDIGVQEVRPERVDLFSEQLRDVRIPQLFPHHRAVLGFRQGMIVGLPGAGLGDLDAQLLQQHGDLVIAIRRAVLRMESQDDKRKSLQQLPDDRNREASLIFSLVCSRASSISITMPGTMTDSARQPLRLMARWKYASASDSFHIGRGSLLTVLICQC